MIQLVLLGSGNVAFHLYKAFSTSQRVQVKQVYNRLENNLDQFDTEVTTDTSKLADADIYLLALKDDAIPHIASQLQSKKALVAHTSGSAGLNALEKCERKGVFYPLQTFSRHKPLDYTQVPFCLEANSPKDLDLLKEMAGEISGKFYEISSEQRKKIHLSAVFVCNFVNHLYSIGEKICEQNDIPFEILKPLIMETAKKIGEASPSEVQTGPAMRNDQSTIQAHLEQLTDPQNKQIYQLLTHAIQSFHGKKL